ncbi:MAG: class I SAM-dependent methyltransferase [Planctomycetota bacterium]|jgi:SAM-dependent methyltransferase
MPPAPTNISGMIVSLQTTLRYWLRAALYRISVGSMARRIRPSKAGARGHETAAYWNAELSGRMSAPNLNGRVSNALRDTATAQLIRLCGPTPTAVLDVGCGLCELAGALVDHGVRRYVGVDLSDYAIDRARRNCAAWPVARQCDLAFHKADLRSFAPPMGEAITFDAIVFNEVLKYVEVDEAAAQLERYARWLVPGGVLCVTMTDDPKCHAITRRLQHRFTWVYGMVYQQRPDGPKFRLTRNRATPPYLISVYRPRNASARARQGSVAR